MHLNDPSVYMQMRGYPPTVVLESAGCPTRFQFLDGVAFPAIRNDGTTIMAAFCCHRATSRPRPPRLWGSLHRRRRGALPELLRKPPVSAEDRRSGAAFWLTE